MGRKTLIVAVLEDQVGVMEFGRILVELHVVSDNLPIILHLDILDCFFHVGYRVNITVGFLKYSEKLEVVVEPL